MFPSTNSPCARLGTAILDSSKSQKKNLKIKKKNWKIESNFTWGRSMIFGAGNGVTTLGLWASSTGFIKWRIRNKMMKKAKTTNPSRALILTFKILMKLWSPILSFWTFRSGFEFRRRSNSSTSVEDLILLRALLLPFPLIYWKTQIHGCQRWSEVFERRI